MAFLLSSQAQGVSGKNEQSIQTPWRGAPEERGPMQLHRLHRLKAGTAYWSDPGLHHSVNVCFLKKSQLRKVSWRRIFCTRNRWWLSPGRYLQESHAPCSSETACLVFAQLNCEDNASMQHRKRQLSNTVENHEDKFMRRNFSIWKRRVYLVFHNTQIHSQSLHFPSVWSRLGFCLSKMALKRAANCTSSSANVNVCTAEENLEEEL